jgi:hypothetical protein
MNNIIPSYKKNLLKRSKILKSSLLNRKTMALPSDRGDIPKKKGTLAYKLHFQGFSLILFVRGEDMEHISYKSVTQKG